MKESIIKKMEWRNDPRTIEVRTSCTVGADKRVSRSHRERPRHRRRVDRLRVRFRRRATLLGIVLVVASVAPVVVDVQSSSATPTFSLAETAPSTVLYGNPSNVTLTASSSDTTAGYNLSFKDVLSAGVSYVPGTTTPSTVGDPTILANEPTSGQTTLIWQDVSDLQPSSSFTLGFALQGTIDTTLPTPSTIIYPGDSYSDATSAYLNTDPREVPQFDATGTASNFTGTQSQSGTTQVAPLKTTLSDPLPENELMRGVHDQKKIWTLTLTNNNVHSTALTEIDAWLPAGLEFLGCGGVDNTTSATSTNPSDAGPAPYVEYPGAPALTAGTTLPTAGSPVDNTSGAPCALPTQVTTENNVVPPGLTGTNNESNPVYSEAQWVFGVGAGQITPTTLGPGQTYTIRYLAAVALLENTMTFNGGTPAGATAEASNLDNNNGADTLNLSTGAGLPQESSAQGIGDYSGTLGSGTDPIGSNGQDTVTIHDLAIQKGESSSTFSEGSNTTFTLNYQTSEYRYSQSVVINDTLPNGMCPIDGTTGNQNFDQSSGTTYAANHNECAPQSGNDPSVEYSSVTENQGPSPGAGSFTLSWNLGTIATDSNATITYQAVDRAYYQTFAAAAFSPAAPTLTGDSLSNSVTIGSSTYATCDDAGTADSECTNPTASAIYASGEPGGNAAPLADAAAETNPSSAGLVAGQPSISKLIAAPTSDGHGGVTCLQPDANFTSSTSLVFQKGDIACFLLNVAFPAGLYTRDPLVEDYLPPNATYVSGDGSGATASNTVGIPATVPNSTVAQSNGDSGAANPVVTATSDGDLVKWYVGSTISTSGNSSLYASPGQVFDDIVAAQLTAPPGQGNTFNLTQNLMKFTSFNSPGAATANRNDATYDLTAPSLTLRKGVLSDGTTTSSTGNTTVGGAFNSNVDGVQVKDGGNAVFRIDVENWSLEPVLTPTIWDVLQSGQTCADVSAVSNGGTCYAAGSSAPTGIDGDSANVTDTTIVWTGANIASVAAATNTTTPGTATLTYQYDVPSTKAAGDVIADQAGLVSWNSQPDTGSAITYYPQTNNIATSDGFTPPTSLGTNDEYAPAPPAGNVEKDPSNVFLPDPSITKAVTPSTATIGQVVKYTVTATDPAGGTLNAGVVTDALGSRLTYDASGPDVTTASCSGGAITGTDTPTLNGGSDGAGFSFTEAANALTLDWPSTLASSSSDAVCTITFDATIADVAANVRGQIVPNHAALTYDNDASSGAGTGSPVTSNTVNVTVIEPDVALTKSDNGTGAPPHQFAPGATVTYTLTLNNQNLANVSSAHDLVATDCVEGSASYVTGSSTITVPSQSTLVGAAADPVVASPGTGSCSSAGDTELTWNLNTRYGSSVTLAKNATATVTYQTALPSQPVGTDTFANAAGLIAASLDVTASPGARTSTTAAGESVPGYSASANDTVIVPGATVTKLASPTTTPVGVDTTFTATVSIPANLSFPDLTGVDLLPDGMTFDAYVSATCEDVVTLGACGSDLSSITTEAAVHDGTTGRTTLGWWLGNVTPNADARMVTLTYTGYPSETFHGGGVVTAGDALVNSIGAYWSSTSGAASANAPTPSSGPSYGFAFNSGTQSATVTVLAPSLSITKSTTVIHPTPGESIPYTVRVSNGASNSTTAYLTTVTDPLPALLSVVGSSISNGGVLSGTNADGSGGVITWTLSGQTIAPSASMTFTYAATLAPSDDFTAATLSGAIANTATVNTNYAVTNATATSDAARYDAYLAQSANASVTPVFPSLTIAKYTGASGTSTTGSTNIGATTPWHLVVTNSTAALATSVTVVDRLPPFWTYDTTSTNISTETAGPVTADPTTSTDPSTHVETLTWSGLGNLDSAGGHQITVTYHATPNTGATTDGSGNTNQSWATFSDATGATGVGPSVSPVPYQSAPAQANDNIPAADLQIIKTHSGNFLSGVGGTYSLNVSNNGPDGAAEPVTVTDTLPVGETFTSTAPSGSGWSCATLVTTLTCTFGATGSTTATSGALGGVISVPVDVSPSAGLGTNVITNTASVSANGTFDPVSSNNTSSNPTTVVGGDLAITKSDAGPITAGRSTSYVISVSNRSTSVDSLASVGSPITVTDTLPTGESFVGASGVGWTCSAVGSTVTCTDPSTIIANTTAPQITLTVNVASSASGTISNTANVAPGLTSDPITANNSATSTLPVQTSADLNISKVLTSPASGLTSGVDATYTISVDNNLGPSDAVLPQVRDVLPAGESFVSATGTGWSCTYASGTVTCTYAASTTLPSGHATAPISLVVLVNSSTVGPITNTAIVCSGTISSGSNSCGGGVVDNGTPDSNTANNSSSAGSSPSVDADLAITKSHVGDFTSGGDGTYTLTVTNKGPADSVGTSAQPITVADTLPTGETFVSASAVDWTCADVAQVVTCTYPHTIVAGTGAPVISLTVKVSSTVALLGNLTNTAQVTLGVTPDPNPANNTATDAATIVGADLSITKTHHGDFVAGEQGTYTITVSNGGPGTAVGPITVVDTLPAGERYVSAAGSGWRCSDGSNGATAQMTCTSDSMITSGARAPAISLVVAVAATVSGTVTNSARVIPGATADPLTSNNTTSDPTVIVARVVLKDADLKIVKSHSGEFVLGAHGTYHLVVTNLGPASDAGPITVTDSLPKGETFVSATGSGWSCAGTTTVSCTRTGVLAPGSAAAPITLTVTVNAAAYPVVTNTASVSSPNPDPNTTNNSSSDPVTPIPVAQLTLAKSLAGELRSGEHATYSITVTDTGPSPANQVVVTDPMPTGLRPVSGSGSRWRCDVVSGTNELRCTIDRLGIDHVTSISVVALVTATTGTVIVNSAQVTSATDSLHGGQPMTTSASNSSMVRAGAVSSTDPPKPPGPPLAFTGLNFVPLVIAGLGLVVAGLATLEIVRRRRRHLTTPRE